MRLIEPTKITGAEGAVTRASTATYFDRSGVMQVAPIDALRIDFSPASGQCRGALLERSATNALTWSTDLSNASWVGSALATIGASRQAPDGTLSAAKLVPSTAAANHALIKAGPTITAGTTVVASAYLQADEYRHAIVQLRATGAFAVAQDTRVDLLTGMAMSGQAGTPVARGIEHIGGGIYRVWVAATATADGIASIAIFVGPSTNFGTAGDGASGLNGWGAQIEVGSKPTSLIPTTTSAGTRAADVVSGTLPCLIYCNAVEPCGDWSAGVSYALGARAIAGRPERIYESAVASNLGNDPMTGVRTWIDVGPANRYAALDQSSGTASTAAGPITVAIKPGLVDSLALIDMVGNAAAVRMYDASTNEVYSSINDLGIGTTTDWLTYFFGEIRRRASLVLDDLPPIGSATIFVTVDDPTAASLGTLAAGRLTELGGTVYGAQVGIIDYSRKDTDAYGATTITQRGYARRLQAQVQVEATKVDSVAATLARLRATPVVWDGLTNYDAGAILGWAREWSVDISYPTVSYCSLTIEGLA